MKNRENRISVSRKDQNCTCQLNENKFIDYVTNTDFYKEKSMRLDKEIGLHLKVSSCNLQHESEEPVFARSKTSSSFNKKPKPIQRGLNEVASAVTYHLKLPTGEFSNLDNETQKTHKNLPAFTIINALALIPESELPKKFISGVDEYDYIKKVQKYLKDLKKNKTDRKITKLKKVLADMKETK
jgi:hypothetical protein